MKKLAVISLCSVLMPFAAYSQYGRSSNRDEYTFAIGLSQALTDIGGSPMDGTHFLRDFNPGALRYAGYFGYRKWLGQSWAVKGVMTIGELYGNDQLSSNIYRHNRNQNFRTFIVEPSLQAEFYFYQHDQPGHRYKIKHAHGFTKFGVDAYLFAGIGGFYFNPQGKYNGTWYNLRPLSTEGEGLPGGPSEYSQFALCFPAGIGARYQINSQWNIGVEGSTRLWSSTDYLDDTHGTYFSPGEIAQYKGPIAAYFSHPVLGDIPGQDAVGQERGDTKNNDTYMFLFVTVSYHPLAHHHRGRGRAKF
jgi:hypothetical protein